MPRQHEGDQAGGDQRDPAGDGHRREPDQLPVRPRAHGSTVSGGWEVWSLRELDTRLVPWERIEVTHAHNRPLSERPPLPGVGDRVWLRQHEWERDLTGRHVPPVPVTVTAVEPDDDPDSRDFVPDLGWVRDPNLWHVVRDMFGQPIYDGEALRYAPVADPWPWLDLQPDDDEYGHPVPAVRAREARLRGSAGWLPWDYLDLPERCRLPADFYLATRPALPPLNVPCLPRPDRG
jgi:hypothetical protein